MRRNKGKRLAPDVNEVEEVVVEKEEKKPSAFQSIRESFAESLMNTTKQLIWLFSINGILWIWCSYILAFADKAQIAEALSSNVCTIVIGQMAMYIISKTVENVFKFNFSPEAKNTGIVFNAEEYESADTVDGMNDTTIYQDVTVDPNCLD